MELIEQMIYAQSLVTNKFMYKTDKVGEPYLYHLHKVATMSFNMGHKFSKYNNDYDFAMRCYIVGLLHDIIEDTDVTKEKLSVFDRDILHAVEKLTHVNNTPYEEYFKRILEEGSTIAIIVKYCDACHNGDIRRYSVVTKEIRKRCRKYHRRANLLAKKLIELR